MQMSHFRAAFVATSLLLPLAALHAGNNTVLPEALQGVNPDMLSGGLFAALDAEGAFGPRPTPPRARASYADLSKGRPPAVLEPRVGLNIRLGDDPNALPATQRGQAEPHIVRSTANPDVLLGTFQEGRYFDSGAINCGYAVSRDGGLTWTRALTPNLTTATGGRYNRATDPVAGAGPQGDLYLQALVSVTGVFSTAAVVVSRSTDSGVTWSMLATVFESNSTLLGPDKNWLAVNDFAGTPNSGRLVSTWSNFIRNAAGGTIGIPLVASVSDDRGVTWSAPSAITPDGSSNQGTQPVFLPDGSLAVIYIAFLDPNNVARFSIHCKRSLDGGRTFPSLATTVVASVAGWDDPDLRDGIYLPSAAVARSTGDLFVTFTGIVAGSPRVLLVRSTDQGATWTEPMVVSDQPAGVSVMNPTVTTDSFGNAVVFFTDKRHAPDGRNFVDHYAALVDPRRGELQVPNVRLTDMSSDIRYGALTSRGIMLGDYIAVAPSLDRNQPCVAIWCDTRTGDADPFTVRFAPYIPFSGQAPDQPYNAWVVARFPTSQINTSNITGATADPDNDGATNLVEYALGTDPRRADFGETLMLTRTSGDALIVQTAIRSVTGAGSITATVLEADGTPSSTPVAARMSSVAAPSVPLVPGLVWNTVELPALAGQAVSVTREISYSRQFGGVVNTERSALPEQPTSGTNSRLINLSTRGRVGSGANQMIVGFVLDGNKRMLVRAAGPALSALGVSGALADPRLTLSAPASDLERTVDNWQQTDSGATPALFARLGAFPFATGSLDAALALPLGTQAYSAIVAGANNASGIALVEAYDADENLGSIGGSRLVNLSTRGQVGSGDNALIGGFVLGGTQPRRVLIRAIGPSLARFDLTGVLADPVLTLFRGSAMIAQNDDWEISRSGPAIAATAQRVGAFALNAASLDAAVLVTLAPGPYTVILAGADGGSGIALVEVYDAN